MAAVREMRLIIAPYRAKGVKERTRERGRSVSPRSGGRNAQIFHTSFILRAAVARFDVARQAARAIRMLRKARETKRSDVSDKRGPVTNVSFRKTRAFPAATMGIAPEQQRALVCVPPSFSKARAIITSISG